MRSAIRLVVLLAACEEPRPPIPDAPRFFDAAPPPSRPATPLAPIAGASAGEGQALFARQCASCHGADGRGGAAPGPLAPTDLTGPAFLCLSTVDGGPTDDDVEAALGRGSHRGRFDKLAPPPRRSLTLYVKTMQPPRPDRQVLDVAPETADTPEDQARGRTLYLAFGCWRCHGATTAGDGTAAKFLAWNKRSLAKLRPLWQRDAYVCGDDPVRLFQTIAVGLGGSPSLMPRHLEMIDAAARPREPPATWAKSLQGVVTDEELARVRAFYAGLADKAEVLRMPLVERRARTARLVWSLVHYVRSVSERSPSPAR